MKRTWVLSLFIVAGCGGSRAPLVPRPSELAADTVRATLIAALLDGPPETGIVGKPVMPRSTGVRPSAVVLAFAVDSTGKPDPTTITIVQVVGDSLYARRACAVIPQTRYTPLSTAGPALGFAHFFTFVPGQTTELRLITKAQLESLTTIQRRDFLLDKGCRRVK